jgi:hypothetical protein
MSDFVGRRGYMATLETELLGFPAADAIDAQLVLGGFPQITQEWRPGTGMWKFLDEQLSNPTSPLIVGGERILSAEFPEEARARQVLETIGTGERTFTTIQRRAGIHETTLQRALAVLVGKKRMVSAERPLSSRPSRETHYAVADSYLRFWLRFVGPYMPEIERERGDLVVWRIREGWSAYRGRAVEPLVRESIFRILPDGRFGDAQYVGGYWTRKGDVEVDLVGAEEKVRPRRVAFVGSIKWRERTPFDGRDLGRIAAQREEVPGTDGDTVLVGVSREGFDQQGRGLDVALVPEDLLEAWKRWFLAFRGVCQDSNSLSGVMAAHRSGATRRTPSASWRSVPELRCSEMFAPRRSAIPSYGVFVAHRGPLLSVEFIADSSLPIKVAVLVKLAAGPARTAPLYGRMVKRYRRKAR